MIVTYKAGKVPAMYTRVVVAIENIRVLRGV